VGFRAAGLEDERQPSGHGQRLEPDLRGQALGVHGALPLHAGQRGALRLGLDDADRLLVDVDQVVGAAVSLRHRGLADGDTLRGKEVAVLAVLHDPACRGELTVDEDAGALLGGQANLVHESPPRPAGREWSELS